MSHRWYLVLGPELTNRGKGKQESSKINFSFLVHEFCITQSLYLLLKTQQPSVGQTN